MSVLPDWSIEKFICVDFDAVLHANSQGWLDGSLYDSPVWHAREGMDQLRSFGLKVFVWSTRFFDRWANGKFWPNQRDEVEAWLKKHEIKHDGFWISEGKPPYWMLIDDRAITFTNWVDVIDQARKRCI